MIERFFTEHPRSVGETYLEHLHSAAGFGTTMVLAGFACLMHALVPRLFVKTGSSAIGRLHDRMVINRTLHAVNVERAFRSTSNQPMRATRKA